MNHASLSIETVHEIRDHCLCLATQRAARVLARRFDRIFAHLGLTNGQFSILVALSGQSKPRLGQLADFLAMDSTTMTAALKTLQKNGFVVLLRDETDARARRPTLTEAGRDILGHAVPLWKEEHQKVQAEIVHADARELASILSQIR